MTKPFCDVCEKEMTYSANYQTQSTEVRAYLHESVVDVTLTTRIKGGEHLCGTCHLDALKGALGIIDESGREELRETLARKANERPLHD